MTDLFGILPMRGEIWKHARTGGHYEVLGVTLNTITDRADVSYRPLYPCDFDRFNRQMLDHPKAFVSRTEDGSPRFVKVADAGAPHQWEWLTHPAKELETAR